MAHKAMTYDYDCLKKHPPPVDPLGVVQGVLASGYGMLGRARFYLLSIGDHRKARLWLRGLLDGSIIGSGVETGEQARMRSLRARTLRAATPTSKRRSVFEHFGFVDGIAQPRIRGLDDRTLEESAVKAYDAPPPVQNVAFTWEGLKRLGFKQDQWVGFDPAFVEGMAGRARWLGDRGDNAPDNWVWGESSSQIHVLLMVYGEGDGSFEDDEDVIREIENRLEEHEMEIERTLDTQLLFRESDPRQAREAHPRLEPYDQLVAPGEFLLGQCDEYDLPTPLPRPSEKSSGSPHPPDDFGTNGSYLILREIEQNPVGLWTRWRSLSSEPEERTWIAAKMMGRWPDGTPVDLESQKGHCGDGSMAGRDGFSYSDDPFGQRCPLGSHTRRAHPRGSILAPDADDAREISNRHRILRRGRTFGPPLALDGDEYPDLEQILALSDADFRELVGDPPRETRGLHFMCFNADITRQFEFIQKNWILNPKFAGLGSDPDPILGQPIVGARKAHFTLPDKPVRRRIPVNEWFAKLRGGAYFFLPSVLDLDYLSQPR